LHHAALGNRPNCVDYLAKKGQDLCADIVSDKVLCRPDANFVRLTTETFEKIQEQKLSMYEARRCEKRWLEDVANLFISLMAGETKHMLAPPCDEVVKV
jgi:microcompartment protein CcmL/EutN